MCTLWLCAGNQAIIDYQLSPCSWLLDASCPREWYHWEYPEHQHSGRCSDILQMQPRKYSSWEDECYLCVTRWNISSRYLDLKPCWPCVQWWDTRSRKPSLILWTQQFTTDFISMECDSIFFLIPGRSQYCCLWKPHPCQWSDCGPATHYYSELNDSLPVSAVRVYSITTKLSVWRRWNLEPWPLPSGMHDDTNNINAFHVTTNSNNRWNAHFNWKDWVDSCFSVGYGFTDACQQCHNDSVSNSVGWRLSKRQPYWTNNPPHSEGKLHSWL